MSADFLNFIVALPSIAGRRYFDKLSSLQCTSDLIGPDEETIAHVTPTEALDLAASARAYAGRLPALPDYGGAWVDLEPSAMMEALERDSLRYESDLSIGDPLLCAIDRVLALPRGVGFLEGKAIARFRPKRRARVYRAWTRLIEGLGGPKGAAAQLAPYLSQTSRGETVRMIKGVTNTLAWADGRDCDVLIFVTPT